MSELSIAESIKQDYEEEIEELKADIEEYRDSTTWWSNRFNAVERDNRELKKEIEKLHSIIKEVREWTNKTVFYFDFEEEITKHAFDLLYTKQGQELLEILEKENK